MILEIKCNVTACLLWNQNLQESCFLIALYSQCEYRIYLSCATLKQVKGSKDVTSHDCFSKLEIIPLFLI